MDVIVNQNAIHVPPGLGTWGELLNWLESDYLKAGQCITRVFLGEREEANYRSTSACDMDLQVIGPVNIESGDFDRILRESFVELDMELTNTLVSSRGIVSLLEARKEKEAYNELTHLLDSIRIFFTVFSEELGWAETGAETSRAELSAALERALTQLVDAQENGFWISICDVLEYEINPVLEAWQKLLARTRDQIN